MTFWDKILYNINPSTPKHAGLIDKLNIIQKNVIIVTSALEKSQIEIDRLRAMNRALIDRIVIEAQNGNCTKDFSEDMVKILEEGMKQCQ